MSAETPGSLPGPHRDRSGESSRSPARLDEEGGDRARAYYGDVIRLPGFGHQPDRCRVRKPVGFCSEAGHVMLASASPCETRRCPEHWSMWQEKAATNLVARLAAYRYVQEGAGKRLLHVVDSPDPERRWTSEAFWEERSASYDVVEEVGGRGGITIPHPYRTNDRGDWLFQEAVARGEWEEEWGKWSFLRSAADDWEELQQFVEEGPHYHHLVAAEDFDPSKVPERRTVKNIRSVERFEIRDMTGYRSMARTAMYLLSHGAYQPPGADGSGGRNTVTYWGEVHPLSFDPSEELTAAEWDRIQRMAERAVTTTPASEVAEAQGEDRPECHRSECEGEVVPIDELAEWMEREEWMASLELDQRWILIGVRAWLEQGADRPPPSAEESRVIRWFRSRGRKYERRRQSGLDAFA